MTEDKKGKNGLFPGSNALIKGGEWQVYPTSAWEAEAGGQLSMDKPVPYRSSPKAPEDAPKTYILFKVLNKSWR